MASRRKSEKLIESGRVRVDGQIVTRLGTTVDLETAVVRVDGRRVRPKPLRWLALHKPPGYACTRGDPTGQRTIYELLPRGDRQLPHVGRLDFMSEGLLLLSNDGDLAHRLLHPGTRIDRVYSVSIARPAPDDLPERLREGVALSDGLARARHARWVLPPRDVPPRYLSPRDALAGGAGGADAALEIVLAEGRNRVIRRILAELGVTILRLRRKAFGPIDLAGLAAGASRELSREERGALARAVARGARSGGGAP